MRAIGPSPGARRGWALMWIMAGRAKVTVFPDPVAEVPLREEEWTNVSGVERENEKEGEEA